MKQVDMDLSKFSDPGFDPKQWVNAALRSNKDAQMPVDVRKLLLYFTGVV